MFKGSFLIYFFLSIHAFAITGLEPLKKRAAEHNHELQSLWHEMESKKSLVEAAQSPYYPHINAIIGTSENNVKDPLFQEKGSFSYLDAKINLFNGFKDQTLARKQELELQLKRIEFEKHQRNLSQQLTEVVSEMLYLHNLQHILKLEDSITRDQVKMASKKTAAGLTSNVDNLEMELREQELQIQIKQIDQLHTECHEKLIQIMGSDFQDDQLEHLQFEKIADFNVTKANVMNLNPDLRRAHVLSEMNALERKIVKSGNLPIIDFTYTLGRITPGQDSSSVLDESKYTLQITIPLFNGYETFHKTNSHSFLSEALHEEGMQTSISITTSYNILLSKFNELQSLYRINELRLETSKKYFHATVAEYKRGIKNSPDLVNATDRWFTAQKRKYELLKELELTKVRIENMI